MEKITMIIATFVVTLSLASALYEGTNIVNPGLDYISNWKIVNNNTWINATKINDTSILITIPELSENLSFSIYFEGYINEEEKVVYVPISSGGGSSTKYIYKNNTIYKDIIQYKDKEIVKQVNETIYLTEKSDDGKLLISLISLFIFTIVLITTIWWIYNLNKGGKLDDTNPRGYVLHEGM